MSNMLIISCKWYLKLNESTQKKLTIQSLGQARQFNVSIIQLCDHCVVLC